MNILKHPGAAAPAFALWAFAFFSSVEAAAQDAASLQSAVEEQHRTDANGQLFSFSIALVGALPGAAVGALGAGDGPLPGLEASNELTRWSSVSLLSASAGLIVHGLMRVYERQASAAVAQRLLADPDALQRGGLTYLQGRALTSRSTRLVGGSLTVLQGLSLVSLGAGTLLEGENADLLSIVLLSAGALTTGIGAVHFFGSTHTERLLQGVQPHLSLAPQQGNLQATVGLQGTF